jgi:hypothetical protein
MQLKPSQAVCAVPQQTGVHGAVGMRRMPASSANAHLHAVVIRLLAVALWRSDFRAAESLTNDLSLPVGYRSWSVVETEGLQDDGRERLKCYVCAKGAATPDDEPFPVGTQFVVETYWSTGRLSCHARIPCNVEAEPARVFIMKKYAAFHAFQWSGDGAPKNEAWACALYRREQQSRTGNQ